MINRPTCTRRWRPEGARRRPDGDPSGITRRLIGGALGAVLPLAILLVMAPPSAQAVDPPPATGPPPAWLQAPVVPELKGKVAKRFRHDVKQSRARKMRARVFAKVGDSNTQLTGVLYGLGCKKARLAGRRSLAAVISRYRRVQLENENGIDGCEPGNSFSRRSAAVSSGTFSNWSTVEVSGLPASGFGKAPSDCNPDETPLSCELRITRPRYVFVMTGSNDITLDLLFAGIPPGSQLSNRLTPVIRTIRRFGSVPVLSTIPPAPRGLLAWRFIGDTNREIWRLSKRLRVPMINLYGALMSPGMVNYGTGPDSAHLGIFGETEFNRVETPGPTTLRDSVNFTRQALRYGSNRRNLIWLKTLRRLDRTVRRG